MTYTEHKTTARAFRVFDCYDIEAQPSDYIAVPGYPIAKVLSRVDSGDYINLVVQEGGNKPYQIDLLKPEVAVAEQERDLEADEEEMSRIIHSAAMEELELYLDWLTEPIGTNPDYIFGTFIEPSDEEIAALPIASNGYHDPNWNAVGCEF